MQQVLVYADSVTWGIIPLTRKRFEFARRCPGVLERQLTDRGLAIRVLEDCLNGRRTVWEDPFKPGRNGLVGLAQRVEMHSPLSLVVLMLGTNDFQVMHPHNAWMSAQGIATLVQAIRTAPIEPGMPVPQVLIVAPPLLRSCPEGPIAPKFAGAETKCVGLVEAFRQVAGDLGCPFFDANEVTTSSQVDGVHLDGEQHRALGLALADLVAILLASHA
jgi:lysophospholipase L1-like esterase